MNAAVHVRFRMVDYLMSEFIKPLVRFQFIAIDGRSGFNVLAYVSLNGLLATITQYGDTDFA